MTTTMRCGGNTYHGDPERALPLRSVSLGYVPLHVRERDDPHFRITYQDDALCQLSLDNVRRLLRAAKSTEDNDTHSNNIHGAKKALEYRRLLRRAQSINLDDPNFDINAFLRITWCKVKPETSQ